MGKHCKHAPSVSPRQYLAAGVSGSMMVGIGLLLASSPGAPTSVTANVQLASVGAPLPLTPGSDDEWWLDLIGSGGAPSNTTLAAAAAISNLDLPCGLVCNGADGTEEHPDGQAGGLLIGNGGNGWDSDTAGVAGGNGGAAGFFVGNGGNGGYGADALYEARGTGQRGSRRRRGRQRRRADRQRRKRRRGRLRQQFLG